MGSPAHQYLRIRLRHDGPARRRSEFGADADRWKDADLRVGIPRPLQPRIPAGWVRVLPVVDVLHIDVGDQVPARERPAPVHPQIQRMRCGEPERVIVRYHQIAEARIAGRRDGSIRSSAIWRYLT